MKLAKTKLEMPCVWENTHCSIIMDGGRQGRMYWLYVAFLYSQEPGCIVKGRGNHSRKTPRVPASCHFLFHQPLPVAFVHMVTRSTCLQALSPSPKQEERQGKMTFFLLIWNSLFWNPTLQISAYILLARTGPLGFTPGSKSSGRGNCSNIYIADSSNIENLMVMMNPYMNEFYLAVSTRQGKRKYGFFSFN